ncbi:hypothetical protein [Cryptosporangium sp. NPDC051539]|uniref:hypothetical protein n=1 Tax=Cryptosporangium sp. NPDC051539 TaxID=3363962 RepID=UPI0037A3E30F
MHLYRILIDVGQRGDVAEYMDATLLRHDWALLRRLILKQLRQLWEERLSLTPAV